MDNHKGVLTFIAMMENVIDNVRRRLLATIHKRRYIMDGILKRDITGECFDECRNIVREAAVKRQKDINRIVRETEMAASDHTQTVSRAI